MRNVHARSSFLGFVGVAVAGVGVVVIFDLSGRQGGVLNESLVGLIGEQRDSLFWDDGLADDADFLVGFATDLVLDADLDLDADFLDACFGVVLGARFGVVLDANCFVEPNASAWAIAL